MFSTMPMIGTSNFLTIWIALLTTIVASPCGVLTMTAPSVGSCCITVIGASEVPGGRSTSR